MEVYIFVLKMENHIYNPYPDYTYIINAATIITVLICVLVEPIVDLF